MTRPALGWQEAFIWSAFSHTLLMWDFEAFVDLHMLIEWVDNERWCDGSSRSAQQSMADITRPHYRECHTASLKQCPDKTRYLHVLLLFRSVFSIEIRTVQTYCLHSVNFPSMGLFLKKMLMPFDHWKSLVDFLDGC